MLHPSKVKETIIFKNLFDDTTLMAVCGPQLHVLSSPARVIIYAAKDLIIIFYQKLLIIGWGFKIEKKLYIKKKKKSHYMKIKGLMISFHERR
jgi:hypothetical protein